MPAYLVLARKYRPATFRDVVGQDHVIQTLVNSILSGRVAHAFLFCGVRGVGKTTVARILAKALNCTERAQGDANPCNACTSCREVASGISVDVQEIDGASHTSVENIREINENIKYPPVSSPYKIIIIDEVHMISINAFNALLKTLEEPPAHAKFIFATTESHKVPATINSRCQRFNFRTISVRDIIAGMSGILEQEGIAATETALALIAREAQGSFRDALSLLDQVIAFGSGLITEQETAAILGIAGRDSFGRLVRAVLDRDPAGALGVVHELFQAGQDPEQLILDMIQYLRNLIVVRTVPGDKRVEGMVDAPPAEVELMEKLVGHASPEEFHNLFGIVLRSENEVKRSGSPWIAVEMTVLRMCHAPEIVSLAEIIKRIDSGALPVERQAGEIPRPSASRPPTRGIKGSTGGPQVPRSEGAPTREQAKEPIGVIFSDTAPAGESAQVAAESLDEVWERLRNRITEAGFSMAIPSLMEHGRLISLGPTVAEIGFHKPVWRSSFEDALETKPELRAIVKEVLGSAQLKILTLAQETSLREEKPYSQTLNGGTDLERALKSEAMDNPVVKAVLSQFEGSYIEDIKVHPTKP